VEAGPADGPVVLLLHGEPSWSFLYRTMLPVLAEVGAGWLEEPFPPYQDRAWREAGKLDLSEPSLMPWLTTVARRIVIDDHRRRQARPIEMADAELANLPAEDHTAATDRRLLVADALRALSPLHRQVLNETILRDRTVNQAAEVLGVPVGTVKSRVYYALRALQVVLAERGVPP